jgi:hypothetical protein
MEEKEGMSNLEQMFHCFTCREVITHYAYLGKSYKCMVCGTTREEPDFDAFTCESDWCLNDRRERINLWRVRNETRRGRTNAVGVRRGTGSLVMSARGAASEEA